MVKCCCIEKIKKITEVKLNEANCAIRLFFEVYKLNMFRLLVHFTMLVDSANRPNDYVF